MVCTYEIEFSAVCLYSELLLEFNVKIDFGFGLFITAPCLAFAFGARLVVGLKLLLVLIFINPRLVDKKLQ